MDVCVVTFTRNFLGLRRKMCERSRVTDHHVLATVTSNVKETTEEVLDNAYPQSNRKVVRRLSPESLHALHECQVPQRCKQDAVNRGCRQRRATGLFFLLQVLPLPAVHTVTGPKLRLLRGSRQLLSKRRFGSGPPFRSLLQTSEHASHSI